MLIRSILSHLHLEILKRNRPPTSTFNFQSASVGNLFLTGARLFSGSFESAIYLLAIMGGVDQSKTAVLPVIVSNFSHHISARLADGNVITGQNAISHPSEPTALNNPGENDQVDQLPPCMHGVDATIEDATFPGSLPNLRKPNIAFSKESEEPLPARIERIWYINPYGQEMRPPPNPKVIDAIHSAEALIYSIGSLYTSIIPSLILQGIGQSISRLGGPRSKILILNGSLDRETGGFTAGDFIAAIARAGEESQNIPFEKNKEGDKSLWGKYVTHLIYLEGDSVPRVDKDELVKYGVESIRLYGRKAEDGVMRYDGKALAQTLGAILGKREKGEKSRRNVSDFSEFPLLSVILPESPNNFHEQIAPEACKTLIYHKRATLTANVRRPSKAEGSVTSSLDLIRCIWYWVPWRSRRLLSVMFSCAIIYVTKVVDKA